MQPFAYQRIDESTWMYLSSFLILSLFFKFNRAWSFRNLDLFLVILLAPGLLLIQAGWQEHYQYRLSQPAVEASLEPESPKADSSRSQTDESILRQDGSATVETLLASEDDRSGGAAILAVPARLASSPTLVPTLDETPDITTEPGVMRQRYGYFWMFSVGGLILIRLLVDPVLVRRPLLEPNLSIGGMVFMGCSLLIFLLANIAVSQPSTEEVQGARGALKLLQREAATESDDSQLVRRGPGYRLAFLIPVLSTFRTSGEIQQIDADEEVNLRRYIIAAKSLAIISQILIVLGLILFCYYNFGSFNTGVSVATMYLLIPYTSMFSGNVMHTVPAALLLWALVCFRRPFWAGMFVGLATGVTYYPLFLLFLWISFYWERGWRRFVTGLLVAIVICVSGLLFTSADTAEFVRQLQAMFGFWQPVMSGLEGIWSLGFNQVWRLPLLVTFILLCISFVAWPIQKDIGTLMAYTAAVMAAVQFWHGFGGGLFVAWYLPIALLVFFRPNLTGRVATTQIPPRKVRKLPATE